MQVTYSSCSTTPAPTVLCSDSRCQIGTCASQTNHENGFNSSCQQCLAERAAAEGNNSSNRINQFGTTATETSFSPDRKSLDRSRSRLDFSPIHDDCNEPMSSLATSVLSTKNISVYKSKPESIVPVYSICLDVLSSSCPIHIGRLLETYALIRQDNT